MAAENKPVKGILKTSKSFDKDGILDHERKEMKWDEMNILATYHPADKDYGHQKVDEPLTPFSKLKDGDLDESDDEEKLFDPSAIAARLEADDGPKVLQQEESSEEEDDLMLTDEERAKRFAFETKRKLHYNEFYAVKLARELMDSDDEDAGGEGQSREPEETENGEDPDDAMDDSPPAASSTNCQPSSSLAK